MSAAQENTVTDAQAQFEDWYVQNAFDYVANPIGSRDCGLMRRAWHAALAARQPGAKVPERRAPVQGYHGGTIPWRVHGLAWEAYARKYPGQDAEKIASRGGFAVQEMDVFLPGWRDMAEGPTAQGIDLGRVREIRIPARNNLDPISVFVQDQAAGRGRIVVTCYGNAWQGFWGAMGDRTVMEFVAQCDADYVTGNMISGRQTRMTKAERAYTERIAAEVIAEFRTLLGQRDAAPGVGNG